MTARRDLLDRLQFIDESSDGQDMEGQRSVAIRSLVAIEEFVRARSIEWTELISDCAVPVSRVPDATRLYKRSAGGGINRVVRDSRLDELPLIFRGLADSFEQLVQGVYAPHWSALAPLSSNIAADDLPRLIEIFGGSRLEAWNALDSVYSELRSIDQNSFRNDFEDLIQRRHRAAHDFSLQKLEGFGRSTSTARLLCATIDAVVSNAVLVTCSLAEEVHPHWSELVAIKTIGGHAPESDEFTSSHFVAYRAIDGGVVDWRVSI